MLKAALLAAPLALLTLASATAQTGQAQPPAGPTVTPDPACPGNPEALGTARVMTIDPATLPPVGLQTYPQSLALADHEVVLTFDDGPSARTTPQVLAALEHECVRAAFFLIGRNAQTASALVKREIADGDLVGHHSWSHPAITERGLPEEVAEADILRGVQADEKAGYGPAATATPHVAVFRFPGFADSPPLLAWLKGRNMAVFGADLWASDWVRQTPEAELALLMGRLDRAGRGIILLHDIKAQTAAMLPSFLEALKAGHYHVVALRIGPGGDQPATRPAPAGWTSATERSLNAAWPTLMKGGAQPWPPPSSAKAAALPLRPTP